MYYLTLFYLKRAVVSVINDLVTDQRVHKSCLTLRKAGFEVLLVGRKLKNSPAQEARPYSCKRMRLLFIKGPFFYIEFNIRLFLLLLWQKPKLFVANDLDTLLPNFIVSRLKRKPLIYDSHEYFTQTPELVNRPFIQNIWKSIERFVLKRIRSMITVNDSIADLYRNEYGIEVAVVRNVPLRNMINNTSTRASLGLPTNKSIVLLQGSGINVERGAEELIHAMKELTHVHLLIIGGGDVLPILHKMVVEFELSEHVQFLGRMPYNQMMAYTQLADLGLTIDKNTNLNYYLSLPNKLFDYIQAGVPVLASNLPEVVRIIETYDIGSFIENHQPHHIAAKIKEILQNRQLLELWRTNAKQAAAQLCWENEEITLLKLYEQHNR